MLATGTHPYDDPLHPKEHALGRVYRAQRKERAPIAELAPDLPPSFQALLEQIIQPDPGSRPQSAKELVAPLKALDS